MNGPEGWDGKSVKEHVEGAHSVAEEGMGIAQSACDDLEVLKAQLAQISTFNAPGTMLTMAQAQRMDRDELAAQADALGILVYEALSSWCLKSAGDEDAQRTYAEGIAFGVKAFCQSIAMQIRGSIGSVGGCKK